MLISAWSAHGEWAPALLLLRRCVIPMSVLNKRSFLRNLCRNFFFSLLYSLSLWKASRLYNVAAEDARLKAKTVAPARGEEVNAPCIQPWEVRSAEIPSMVSAFGIICSDHSRLPWISQACDKMLYKCECASVQCAWKLEAFWQPEINEKWK